MRLNLLLLMSFIALLFFGCNVPNATPLKNNELTIVSDFLKPGDSKIFKRFVKHSGCSVRVIHMNADSLSKILLEKPNSTGYDIIMLESTVDVRKLHLKNQLHDISIKEEWPKRVIEQGSNKYHFVTWGVNPIVFTYTDTAKSHIRTYADLTRNKYINELSSNEQIILFSATLEELDKAEASSWIKKVLHHSANDQDSLNHLYTTLSTYKKYQQIAEANEHHKYLFPNQYSGGTLYVPCTFTVVDQADDYTWAMEFIEFHLDQTENEHLNEAIGTLTIFAPGKLFHSYSANSEELISNYEIVKRIVEKVNKD